MQPTIDEDQIRRVTHATLAEMYGMGQPRETVKACILGAIGASHFTLVENDCCRVYAEISCSCGVPWRVNVLIRESPEKAFGTLICVEYDPSARAAA